MFRDIPIPESNPFRIAFFVMMLTKGVSYGVFGVRTTPEHAAVTMWEQASGVILLLACLSVLVGLFSNPSVNRLVLLRWGYLAFALASFFFALGSFGYGVEGTISGLINLMLAYAGWHDSRRENQVIRSLV